MGNRGRATVGTVAIGLLASFLPWHAASAAPGDLHPTFGGGDGRASVSAGFDVESVIDHEIEVSADGGTFLLTELPFGLGVRPAVVRFDPDGAVDPGWNLGNPVYPAQEGEDTQTITIAVDAMDRLVVATGPLVFRYTTTGVPDPGFSGDGAVDLRPAQGFQVRDVEALPGGALAVLGTRESASPRLMMVRLTAGGAPDASFSGDGRFEVPTPDAPANPIASALDLDVDASGNLYSLGVDSDRALHVAKVSSAGSAVDAFGGNGVAGIPGEPYQDAELAIDASGRPTVIAPVPSAYEIARLTATGVPDESYGPGGLVTLSGPNAVGQPISVTGSTAYLSTCSSGGMLEAVVVAVDLTSATLRTSFGPGGADGDGVRTIATTPVGEACSGAIDVTSTGHPRVFITPFDLFGGVPDRPTELVQLTPTGADDLTYSGDARSPAGVRHHRLGRPTALAEGPGGDLVVGGDVVTAGGSEPISDAFVGKVTAAGLPAPGFGDGGRVEIPSVNGSPVTVHDIAVLPDGRVAVLHHEEIFVPGFSSYVTLLDASGDPDPSFGGDGTVAVGISSSERPVTSITTAGSGAGLAIFVGGRPPGSGADIFVQRVNLAGTIDQAYGAADGSNDGWAGVNFPMRDDVLNERPIAGAPDGTVVWGAPAITTGPGEGLALGKLLASGAVDSAFGSGGMRLLPGSAGVTPDGTLDAPMHLRRRTGGGRGPPGRAPQRIRRGGGGAGIRRRRAGHELLG